MPRGDLYPEIGPFETGYLPLTAGHVMYWEQVGNPRGRPVLFLHGGPGAGAGAVHRRFFDPDFWRVIIFDQRGAGRSRPLGSLAHNTTQDLVGDIETLRRHLGIDRLLLFGGSWGSTLALAYTQATRRTSPAVCCAACSWAASRRSTGSCMGCAPSTRTPTAISPVSCRKTNAATSSAAICGG